MVRILSLAAVLVVLSAVSATAQITSIPVVTSWPSDVRLTTYALPAQAPVALDVCAPPVVTFCNPCVTGGVPAAPMMTVNAPTTTYYLPTTAYYAPTTAFRVPVVASVRRPAAVAYYAPAAVYSSPLTSYRMPAAPEMSVSALPVTIAPTTSYYAPAVSAPALMSAPVSAGRSCGCGGH
ncbi:MAG: hypothetical protein ACYC6N_21105 [Pirellulaceae bacterium]